MLLASTQCPLLRRILVNPSASLQSYFIIHLSRSYSATSVSTTIVQEKGVILPKDALSPQRLKSCVDTLKLMKIPGRIKRDLSMKNKYSVLIPFCLNQDEEPCVLLTLRSSNLSSHKSQMSFPGGQMDAVDGNDPVKTALRETNEEIGLKTSLVKVYGTLNPLPTRDSTGLIFPVISFVESLEMKSLEINKDEVDGVFLVRLSSLCDSNKWRYTRWKKSGLALPVYRDETFDDVHVPRIFGITALMLHFVLSSLIPEHYLFNYELFQTNAPKKK